MTISEQLHFSILSAPIASADRRALSQAWYSALYRSNGKQPAAAAGAKAGYGRTAAAAVNCAKVSGAPAPTTVLRAARAERNVPPAASSERRAPHLRLARQIEHLALRRESKRAAATFVLDGTRARVRVLVVAGGGSVQLIAICSKRVHESVARALAQARYASAARGIVLNAITQEDVRC